MTISCFCRQDITPETIASLLYLYDPSARHGDRYTRAIEESSLICIARDDARGVVGAVRVLTDFFQSAYIVDLLVYPECRGVGVATDLMRETMSILKGYEIRNIELIADPSSPWLPGFYQSLGFRSDPCYGAYMHFYDDYTSH